jgi:hypothetical protein
MGVRPEQFDVSVNAVTFPASPASAGEALPQGRSTRFVFFGLRPGRIERGQICRSFLVLFFKKEHACFDKSGSKRIGIEL